MHNTHTPPYRLLLFRIYIFYNFSINFVVDSDSIDLNGSICSAIYILYTVCRMAQTSEWHVSLIKFNWNISISPIECETFVIMMVDKLTPYNNHEVWCHHIQMYVLYTIHILYLKQPLKRRGVLMKYGKILYISRCHSTFFFLSHQQLTRSLRNRRTCIRDIFWLFV